MVYRRSLALAALFGVTAGLTAGSTAARGDELRGSAGPALQAQHRVSVTLKRGYAVWRAERQLSSAVHNEAVLDIVMPRASGQDSHAVVTSLSLRADDTWRDAALLDADTALDRHSSGDGVDAASALMSFGFGATAELRVKGVAPRAAQTVRYTLLVPTHYEGGRHAFTIGPSALSMQLRAECDGGTLLVDGRPFPAGAPIRYEPSAGVELALRPDGAPPIEGELVVIPFGDRFITRARIAVAPRLSVAPMRPYVVLALDTSRSLGAARHAAMRAAARAYLGHVPHAHVEVVSFARRASARYGRFVSVATALDDLRTWEPELGNGTEPEHALARATALLREAPDGAPKRIVMMSDGMLRRDLRIETLADTLVPELALTHVVKLEASPGVYLTREDDGDWADLARATGGLAWYGTASADASHVADMARAFEPLVRPVTLDQVKESLPWWIEPSVLIFPDQLAEGTGASLLAVGAVALPWIELRAKSWHDTLRLPLSATGDDDGVWSALAFGDSAFFPSNPDDADLVALARRGGAVTPLTSYLVGQTEQPPIEHGGDASGFGRRARMSNCGGVQLSGRHPGNRKRWLEEKLRHAWYDCGGAMHAAQAHFETVQGEVVAVREVTASAGAAPTMAACLAESIWRIQLHEMFADDERSDWSIDATPIFHARFAP